MSKFLLIVLVMLIANSCGLYEEVPAFEDVADATCGECGPCDVGTVDCQSGECSFEAPWEGVVDEEMACNEVVFVGAGGSDDNSGSAEEPVASLETAVSRFNEREASVIAILGEGDFTGFRVEEGMALVGGLDKELKSVEDRPVLHANGDNEHATALEINGVSRTVNIVGVDIESDGGLTNYGVRAIDSNSVSLRGLRIRARAGADGEDGADGAQGPQGDAGEDGGEGNRWRGGFSGVNEECPSANGGDGGGGARAGLEEEEQGEDSVGGAVGRTGDGEDGFSVSDGSDGADGEASSLVDGLWLRGEPGEKGEDGETGIGGAGGGGGRVNGDSGAGGGGGGGGAGGCGGEGGGGGDSGGSSIGVLAVESVVELTDVEVVSGAGGDGGDGGAGGSGGEGRRGGSGAFGDGSGDDGYDGGRGGDGGAGGSGGAGKGGNSFTLVCGKNTEIEVNQGVSLEHEAGGRQLDGRADSGDSVGCAQ